MTFGSFPVQHSIWALNQSHGLMACSLSECVSSHFGGGYMCQRENVCFGMFVHGWKCFIICTQCVSLPSLFMAPACQRREVWGFLSTCRSNASIFVATWLLLLNSAVTHPITVLVLTNPMWQSADNCRHAERECSRDMWGNRNKSKDGWWREKREEGAWLRIPCNCTMIFFFGQIVFLIKEENMNYVQCLQKNRLFFFWYFFGTLIIHWRTSTSTGGNSPKFGNNALGID